MRLNVKNQNIYLTQCEIDAKESNELNEGKQAVLASVIETREKNELLDFISKVQAF